MNAFLGGARSVVLAGLLAALPTSTNYSLKAYDLGGGGGGSGSSTNYKLNTSVGSQSGPTASSENYATAPGVVPNMNSNVPPAPALTNPSSYYDRLKLVLATGQNAADTKYAIAISSDNFATTRYVKSDHSTGGTLVIGDYQTYAAWGGAAGFLIVGLQPGTTYSVKVKAFQGTFSESRYGPVATASTVQPFITFTIATSTNPTPPFSVGFTSLAIDTVFNADADASISLSTNALLGGSVYIRGNNAGLRSVTKSYTLPSATTDLSSAARGYGAVVTSVGQTSGGPFITSAPYNGSGDNVGAIGSSLREIASTAAPITGGALTARLKAKTDLNVPASNDYSDILTFVAAMAF